MYVYSLIVCTCIAAQGTPLDNLDFSSGTLSGWQGQGFAVLAREDKNAKQAGAVTSRDTGSEGRTGVLHRSLVIPADAAVILFAGCAILGKDCAADGPLDVVLLTGGNRVIPKQVRTTAGWQKVRHMLPGEEDRPAEYLWQVAAYAGQTVRIVLLDQDNRPGCSVYCNGFQILTQEEFEVQEFSRRMVGLARERKLFPMTRYDSRHFIAFSNADESYSKSQLRNCELMVSLFYEHFRRKGFAVRQPANRLMVAMFDSQTGFEAYLGRKMPSLVTGIYDRDSNRFVLYDYGQNQAFQASKQQARREGQAIHLEMDRLRYLESIERLAKDSRTDFNLTTIMHEVAHQLSFNCGLLNRQGELPAWLCEGLACYCESSSNGGWQGIGEPSPQRLRALAECLGSKGQFLKLRDLLVSDQWLQRKHDTKAILLGYGQSWALFHMLIEEEPRALKDYLHLVYSQQAIERRVADFQQAFGSDLDRLERRYLDYMKSLVRLHVPRSGTP